MDTSFVELMGWARLAVERCVALKPGEQALIVSDTRAQEYRGATAIIQALMAAVCKTYAAQVEAGEQVLPLPQRGGATATEVMVTASGLLKAANLAVFELGMWQSWTGR